MHVAIRADGGPSIGFGHLFRSGALAAYARSEGDRVTYATETPDHARAAAPDGVDVVDLGGEQGHAAFLSWLSTSAPDVVLTDSYDVGTGRQSRIRSRVPCLAVVLDDARFAVDTDVLVNGNVYAPDLAYEWEGVEPTWCLGTDYLLLRASVRELASREPPVRESAASALVTIGGSDTQNATPDIVEAFDGSTLAVDVIVGPGFENRTEIERAAARTDAAITLVEDPPDLYERMFDADLAVSATGTTVYELLALGTPTIGRPQVDNQVPIADALHEQEAVVVPEREGASLAATIENISTDPHRRRALRKRGRALIDGCGIRRVYETLVTELGRDDADQR